MANVYIYPEHVELLNLLITSSKVSSKIGATETGPFKDMRDAYVFAASIGFALEDCATLPKLRSKDAALIRDGVLLGADGARALCYSAVLLQGPDPEDLNPAVLSELLGQLTADDWTEKFALLDGYAYAGFSWLLKNLRDTQSIRDLILETIDSLSSRDDRRDHQPEETYALTEFLL